jgi:hypothetical protein
MECASTVINVAAACRRAQRRQYSGVKSTSTGMISRRPIHINPLMYSFAAFEKPR